MNNADSQPSVQEANVVVRVSVLDLDNTVFSAGRHMRGRGNNLCHMLALDRSPQHQSEINLILKAINSVDIVSL